MDGHQVRIDEGGEYKGETYLRCSCGSLFDDAQLGLPGLLFWLREHGAIAC
jgi:hypothetical protein